MVWNIKALKTANSDSKLIEVQNCMHTGLEQPNTNTRDGVMNKFSLSSVDVLTGGGKKDVVEIYK